MRGTPYASISSVVSVELGVAHGTVAADAAHRSVFGRDMKVSVLLGGLPGVSPALRGGAHQQARLDGLDDVLVAGAARLLGDLDDRPQIVLIQNPEWLALRARLVAVLRPYPDAALAVAEALDHAG